MSSLQQAKVFETAPVMAAILPLSLNLQRDVYENYRHRVYSLAFWMSDNELAAEQLMTNVFRRAFSGTPTPTSDEIDRALIAELRGFTALGELTLDCGACDQVVSVRKNALRVDLERAVVQLPATEKMIFLLHDVEQYDHSRIARLLQLSEDQSRFGLHQARLRMRELLAP